MGILSRSECPKVVVLAQLWGQAVYSLRSGQGIRGSVAGGKETSQQCWEGGVGALLP